MKKLTLLHLLVGLLIILSASVSFAQAPKPLDISKVQEGIVRIKVTEAYARQLESSNMRMSPSNVVLTGVQPLDKVHQQYNARTMKRVFPHAGKYEAKHRKHGLHLWYEVEVGKGASLQSAMQAYDGLEQVTHTEPVLKKKVIGPDASGFNPLNLDKELAESQNRMQSLAADADAPFNDELLSKQWHYNNTGQLNGTAGADISLFDAWQLEAGKSNVIVAVVDGGIQLNHPDLKDNLWINKGEVAGNSIDDDGNGFVDDVHGYNFVNDNADIAQHFHGTHVAGTVAASNNNGIGVGGVAGGTGNGDGVRLMSCAVFKGYFPSGGEESGGFAQTYVYSADNGAVISQNSWGYTAPDYYEQVVLDAIDYFIAEAGTDENGNQTGPMKGGIVIFAAGNENHGGLWYPGAYEPVLSVAATGFKDIKSSYSNYGAWVDIAAPGGDGDNRDITDLRSVLSTWIDGGYAAVSGTSMACPHVSGVAALVVSKFGGTGFTPEMLRRRLIESTDNINAQNQFHLGLLGAGRLNALKALQTADETAPNPITDLTVDKTGPHYLTLSWTVPADGDTTLSAYDVRYATIPITEENFEEATPAPWKGSFVPKAPGSTESFTFKGLEPETTYYVAVKTVDYSGNISAISNVVEQKTNPAPAITLTPVTLSASLLTAETTTESVLISNNGPGELEFNVEGSSGAVKFASISPKSGTVAPAGSITLAVTFDAAALVSGTYEQTINISTNDPLNEAITLTLSLEVTSNNSPIAILETTELDFGAVILGVKEQKHVKIHNAGADTLTLQDAAISGTGFSVNWQDALVVAPFKSLMIPVTYTPSGLGTRTGILTINTNDAANPVLKVPLAGTGVPEPGISVSPDSIYASLKSNEKQQHSLLIRNTGGSDLAYNIQAVAPENGSPTTTQIQLSSKATAQEGIQGTNFLHKAPATPGNTRTLSLKAMKSAANLLKVGILSPDQDVSEFVQILDGFEDIEAAAFPLSEMPGISGAALAAYDVVIITNNIPWLAAGVDAEQVGNALADYVDAGGKVIVSGGAYLNADYDVFRMKGRFITENYGPFLEITEQPWYDHVNMSKKLVPEHPILAEVEAVFFDGMVLPVKVANGATALAEWKSEYEDISYIMAAANQNTVGINMFPIIYGSTEGVWTGDVPTLYHNAIRWLIPAPYVTITPKSGVVPPGEEQEVTVALDATGLNTGIFKAALAVYNNIPEHEPVYVPLTMDVAGPMFTATPDSLEITIDKKEKLRRTVVLKNNGTGTYDFTISQQNTHIATGPLAPEAAGSMVQQELKQTEAAAEEPIDIREIQARYGAPAQINASEISPGAYKTDFEGFAYGSINYQELWAIANGDGSFSGWDIDTVGDYASSGKKYVHKVSNPATWSSLYSPMVTPGTDAKSTTRMNLNFQGRGANWEVVFNISNPFGAPVTIVAIKPDGSMHAAVRKDNRYSLVSMDEILPQGSFELELELDRATHIFTLYMNDRKVFSGQAMGDGDVERVVFGSGTETDNMHLYIDDFEIREGAREEPPAYLSFYPQSGSLAPGEEAEITVDFDGTLIGYGTYRSDLLVNIAGAQRIVVPTALTLTGASAISLNRTVLNNTIDYKKQAESQFEISNTGGSPINYSIDVVGGTVVIDSTSARVAPQMTAAELLHIKEKQLQDEMRSKPVAATTATAVQVMAGKALLTEDFEESFPPASWSMGKQGWKTAKAPGVNNYSGSGGAATLVMEADQNGATDQELITPVIKVGASKQLVLQYGANYQNYANQDFLDLDIRVNGEKAWTNILHWNEDHGQLHGSGELVQVALAEYLQDAATFQLRWHYSSSNSEAWYAQLDNVQVLEDAKPWLTVSPASGVLPARGTADIKVTFDATYLEAGDFVAGLVVNSDAANAPQVGVVASLKVRKPALVTLSHDSIYIEQPWGYLAEQKMVLTNTGASSYEFSFESKENWIGAFPDPLNTELIVEAESSKGITVQLNTIQDEGLYHDTLYIRSKESFYPDIMIPVTLKVLPPVPSFSVEPADTIRAEVESGSVVSVPITVYNWGEGLLNFSMENLNDLSYLSFSPEGAEGLEYGASVTVNVNFDASALSPGVYRDTLFYKTNDPRFPDYAYHPFVLSVMPGAVKPGIESFSLVDVNSGNVISTFTDSLAIDAADAGFFTYGIVANTTATVGSVSFSLDGGVNNLVNQQPYLLSRLALAQLSQGAHQLSTKAFSQTGGRGEELLGKEAILYLINTATITGVEVVSTKGIKLKELQSGDTINIQEKEYKKISLLAHSSHRVGSMKFYLNGTYYGTDNAAPFSLTGDKKKDYMPWPVEEGHYALTVVPYSLPYATGIAGEAYTLEFEVVKENAKAAAVVTLYPVPARDALHFRLQEPVSGAVEVLIRNSQGQTIYKKQVAGESLSTLSIDLQGMGVQPGVYYLQLVGKDGFKQSQTFVKQ
ncbi:S8 family serine peptidase [Cesiribacter sp. SM1]|uniref:S8 family serine peptidase n=1 Tax=Cesiribacter sp. SM1 TaxID=2861196 RepID=UPI001CD20853|nr:S8 family serine peptidase [Cesiribacter sp. SM1]